MMNFAAIMGRLTRDPELRRTGNGVAVSSFTVAVDRDYGPKGEEKQTDFVDCTAWRNTGEFIAKYFKKGSMIVCVGRLEQRSWTDKDGNKHTKLELVVENAYFGEGKRQNDGASQVGAYGTPGQNSYGYAAPPAPQQAGYAPAPQQAGYAPAPQQNGYNAPVPQQGGYAPAPQQNGYNAPAPQQPSGYSAPAPQPGNYQGYAQPAPANFAMLEGDDAQLPF